MMATTAGMRPRPPGLLSGALLIVVLAALALRLYGLNWDQGTDLHPDELFIAKIVLIDRIHFSWPPNLTELLDPAKSGLNPRSADPQTGQFREFAYGALPLWVTDFTAWALSHLTGIDWNSADRAYLVGRAISALLGALTILPVAALGMAAGGRAVALLAALFAAIAPMSVQLGHFFTTDSWLAFFVALCLAANVRAARRGTVASFLVAGAVFGLAMATKGSVVPLAAPVGTAILVDAARRRDLVGWAQATLDALRRGAAVAAAAVVAFLAFEPYALLRPDVYLQSLRTQAEIASGRFDVPFTRVYVGTFPVAYQVEQFVRWGYGPVAGLLAIAGLGWLAHLALRRRSAVALILLVWLVAYGAVLAVSEVKFLRYLEPLAPVFAVAAALAVMESSRWLACHAPTGLWRLAIPTALIASVAWSGAFESIYAHENPRLAASRWIYASVPPGSTLGAEYWDDALPRGLGFAFTGSSFGFGSRMMDLYRDLPPPEASDALYDAIGHVDYIVQSSQRVESAMRADPWRYPVQERYFDLLENGSLGFARVGSFARMPSIGAVGFDDRRADESFINYDHPRVGIYQRVSPVSRGDYDAQMTWALQRPWSATREPPQPSLLLPAPVGENPAVSDGRWSATVTTATVPAMLAWLAPLVSLLVVGLPLVRWLFPRFPDGGWGLARTLALVTAAFPVWLGASLQLFRFRALYVIASLLVVGIGGWWLRRRGDQGVARMSIRGDAVWLHAEAAFWLVFVLFLAFRLITPDGWHPFWGGEKPMEFAQINAIERSAFFPPYDPWYADGYINYYYYGFYLVAFLFKATGIPAEVGFNLALPTFMALLASGGFCVAAALSRQLTGSRRLTLLGGWCGAAALSVLGNLSALRTMADASSAALDPFIRWTWNGSRAVDNAITEFPFFSGLYADLHSHVIALPLTVAVIGTCVAIATDSEFPAASRHDFSRRFLGRLVVLALLLGTLSATNAWDVPVYAALAVAATLMAAMRASSPTRKALVFVGGVGLALGGAWLVYLPFRLHFVALFGSLALVHDSTDLTQFLTHFGALLAVAAMGLTTLLMPWRSPLPADHPPPWQVAAVGAAPLVLLVVTGRAGPNSGALLIGAAFAGPPLYAAWLRASRDHSWLAQGLVVVALLVSLAAVTAGRAVFGLMFALGCTGVLGWLELRRPPQRFVCLLLAAACFTAAGPEIVIVADDLIESAAYRMNTIFKFYNQVWVLLALADAALVALMAHTAMARGRTSVARLAPVMPRAAWSRLGVVMAAVLALAALSYPLLATGPRLAQRFTPGTESGTLNAFAWMRQGEVPVFGASDEADISYAGDAAAIQWLFDNVHDTAVIAEASIGPYRCNGSRISSATGLPTIIGWERHEQQQRYPDTLPARVEDVRQLYTSSDPAEKAAILRKYNVQYVVVGDLERLYPQANNECSPTGSADGIAAFGRMVGTTLAVAFTSGRTTVYRVLPMPAA
jgi:YYY domain-containing protein